MVGYLQQQEEERMDGRTIEHGDANEPTGSSRSPILDLQA